MNILDIKSYPYFFGPDYVIGALTTLSAKMRKEAKTAASNFIDRVNKN